MTTQANALKGWTTIDKSGWGDGPWSAEPDKIQWIDATTDLDCLIVRGPVGNLCGYVGVPPEHLWHGVDYAGREIPNEIGGDRDPENAPESIIDVHGGLTYSDRCWEDTPEDRGVCHVPTPGRPADVWWFGFDCAHLMDRSPGLDAREREMGFDEIPTPWGPKEYRDVAYVKAEVASLARQLAAVR